MKTQIRPLWKDILAAIWLGILLPGIILHAAVLTERRNQPLQPSISPEEPTRSVVLLRSGGNGRVEMDITTYLTGVLLSEMPASFEEEALKAQSVAARTYTMKAVLTGGKHGDGSLCDDSRCCQGFVTAETYLSGGGTQESVDKVCKAVEETAPQVLEYAGELIEAVYFSSSAGRTESAFAVWGADYPYLQSVESPEEGSSDYQNRIHKITVRDFQQKLGITLTDIPDEWFSQVRLTQGGGVESITICGTEFTGIQLRNLLELPSTVFSLSAEGDNITIVTSGYGHRVGLSQYGANSMAKEGAGYTEILAHYYPGTVLIPME